MSTNGFATPDKAGDGITWGDHKGSLILIEPKMVRQDVETIHGRTDAVEAEVTVIDGPGAPHRYASTLIFPRMLVAQTRNKIGEKILGRLGQGPAKPGKTAAWLLNDATESDIQTATAFLAADLRRPASSSPVPAGRQSFSDDTPPF